VSAPYPTKWLSEGFLHNPSLNPNYKQLVSAFNTSFLCQPRCTEAYYQCTSQNLIMVRSHEVLYLTISATFKEMSKLERREPCRVSGHNANSSNMCLPGARLHQPVATASGGTRRGNGKQDSHQTLSQPVPYARSGRTMLNPEVVLP